MGEMVGETEEVRIGGMDCGIWSYANFSVGFGRNKIKGRGAEFRGGMQVGMRLH